MRLLLLRSIKQSFQNLLLFVDATAQHDEEVAQLRHEWSEERAEMERDTHELRESFNKRVEAKVEVIVLETIYDWYLLTHLTNFFAVTSLLNELYKNSQMTILIFTFHSRLINRFILLLVDVLHFIHCMVRHDSA